VLADLGAPHLTTKPHRPRTKGKAERFIQTAAALVGQKLGIGKATGVARRRSSG
jgi:transposase